MRHQVIRCEAARRLQARRAKEYRCGVADQRMLPATGTVRRLQGLCAEGFTRDQVAAELGVTVREVDHLLHRTVVTAALALTVAEVCQVLMTGMPPSGRPAVRARTIARNRGWWPLDAWFDIDADPDPSTVDEITVMHAVAGYFRWGQLGEQEQHLVVGELTGRGWSDVRIGEHLATTHSRIAAARRRLGIAACRTRRTA